MPAAKLFVAATRQNDGKTSLSLGLFAALQAHFPRMAYMKPVGQQYKVIDNEKIDKDAILFQKVYNLTDSLSDMSPIAVEQGFTEQYILNPTPDTLHERIKTAYARLSQNKDLVLLEGTGHGGVGAVMDTSNGDVAHFLDAPVILVALGGIGKTVDEILLNKAFFESRGARIIGVIINKVRTDKWDKIEHSLRASLKRHNLPILGIIPFVTNLTKPTVRELKEELNATVLCGDEFLTNSVKKFVIGAMLPHDAMSHFSNETLLIVPANREDLIITAIYGRLSATHNFNISAIILTGGIPPHEKILELVSNAKIPMLIVEEDSFTVATDINSMLIKLRAEETEKMMTLQSLVETYVDINAICTLIKTH